jgi:hypothetical protein
LPAPSSSGETIAEEFGEDVAGLVMEVTGCPGPQSHHEEARQQPDLCLGRASPHSRVLHFQKMIDKGSPALPFRRCVACQADWPVERQEEYVRWGRDVVAGLRGAAAELEVLFDQAAKKATRQIAGRRT